MFNFGNKKGYVEQIKEAIAKNDLSKIENIARAAYKDSNANENDLARIG